jgi:hypothetical protein
VTNLTVLTASGYGLATKILSRGTAGDIVKTNPRMPKEFTVEVETVDTIHQLANVLTSLATEPNSFVIRGEPLLDYQRPVRRLKHNSEDATATFRSKPSGERWVCFDFDTVPCAPEIDAKEAPGDALCYLTYLLPNEFHFATFWAQWSSSAGIKGWTNLSAHLWFMLDTPIHDDQLNAWAKQSGCPIDARLFNAVQPHFTAAPILTGVRDPVKQRHGLIKREADTVEFAA